MRISRQLPPTFLAACAMLAAQQTPTFRVTSNLIIVNVEVKGRDGKAVEGLTVNDFELLESGKPQRIAVFEYQRMDLAPGQTAVPATVSAAPAPPAAAGRISASKPGELRYRDRRLIVLFFDLSSMAVAEQIRARRAAEDYLNRLMAPNDLVAVMALSTRLRVLQDFTGDKETLLTAIRSLRVGEGADIADAANEAVEDTGAAFSADTSEFDIFNTDRKLSALESAVNMLASLPEKKALVYFSSGTSRTGTENESQLRSTVNAAVRANVGFYPVDARGLVAEAPAGDSSVGSMRGSALYSGQAQSQRRQQALSAQDTLYTLAADTGGKALLDTNDLSAAIVQAQRDFSSYYVLGYYTSDPNEDGRYRRIQVRVKSPERLKLDYRAGYFAPKSFAKYTDADRERQLEEALRLGDPVTDLRLALEINYFRRARDRYIVPVAVKIPGSEIPVVRKKDKDEARLDFIAEVRDARGRPVASVRDFIRIRLAGEDAGRLASRLLQYDTAFTLPPDRYHIKFVARENESGRLGTFETQFTVPDLARETAYLPTSSIVWGSQRVPLSNAVGSAARKAALARAHPLVREGSKLIPSITKVFRSGEDLYVFLEAYQPTTTGAKPADIAASVSIFAGKGKALESEPVTVQAAARTPSVPIEFRVPLAGLGPGNYVCQLSVVDRAAGKFAFSRTPLVILE